MCDCFKFEVGELVAMANRDVAGRVTSVMRDGRGNQYHVAWWDKRERRTAWVDEFELEPASAIDGPKTELCTEDPPIDGGVVEMASPEERKVSDPAA